MMNSTIAALEAAFPLEKILYCRGCGLRLNDLGLKKIPSNCPVCGILTENNPNDDSTAQSDG